MKSGKLTTGLYVDFFNRCLKWDRSLVRQSALKPTQPPPYIGKEQFLLIIDLCCGQTKPELYDEIFQDDEKFPTYTIKGISSKCTPLV